MALAGTYNITLDQGATYSTQLTYKDSAGALIDLTGYTARMQVRIQVDSASTVLDLTTENGRIILGGAAGTINLTVDAVTTAALTAGQYVYDLELVNGAVVDRLIMGTFLVRPEVTR